MPLELALEYEQERYAEQQQYAAEWREIEEFELQTFGKGCLCACGMVIATNCPCDRPF